jgi:hypothetical protein
MEAHTLRGIDLSEGGVLTLFVGQQAKNAAVDK